MNRYVRYLRQKVTDIGSWALCTILFARVPRKRLPTEHHGSDYGGWVISPSYLRQHSVVYSFGIGEDISFDLSIIQKYGCQVFAFDPTPRSIAWLQKQSLPAEFHSYEFGIGDYDGTARFFAPENPSYVSHTVLANVYDSAVIEVDVFRLQTIMKRLGHPHIDLLKMDIEGAEYQVIDDLIAAGIKPTQLLIEFHHRFKGVGLFKTTRAVNALTAHGYKLFDISENYLEFAFIYED